MATECLCLRIFLLHEASIWFFSPLILPLRGRHFLSLLPCCILSGRRWCPSRNVMCGGPIELPDIHNACIFRLDGTEYDCPFFEEMTIMTLHARVFTALNCGLWIRWWFLSGVRGSLHWGDRASGCSGWRAIGDPFRGCYRPGSWPVTPETASEEQDGHVVSAAGSSSYCLSETRSIFPRGPWGLDLPLFGPSLSRVN